MNTGIYIVIQTSFLLGWYGEEERNKTERISEEADILGWVPSHRCQSHAYASTCHSSSLKRSHRFPRDDKDLSNFYYNAEVVMGFVLLRYGTIIIIF
jgi:hypothetical protein